MRAQVSVLGCGWLGFALAVQLRAQGYSVKGSTTTLTKIPVLHKAGIFPFYLTVGGPVQGESVAEFFDSPVIVVTLPFRRDFTDPEQYLRQLQEVLGCCERSPSTEAVVLTSSTSVYPDDMGEALEDRPFVPQDPRARVLLSCERLFLDHPRLRATVVRLAGLYGGGRRIGKFLAGQTDLPDPDRCVNLLHQDDAVNILFEVIRQQCYGQIFNACADAHPRRAELYTKAAAQLGLPAPRFRPGQTTAQKIVSNAKVKQILGYEFLHPDPMALDD